VLTLDQFLAGVERKAYRMAMMAVKNDADALDIVQDSMIKLAQSYGQHEGTEASEQWRPLFYTILSNCIMDFHRSQSRWRRWFSRPADRAVDTEEDDAEIADQYSLQHEFSPEQYLHSEQLGAKALAAIEELPPKQQQCFLLRSWEGFSVKETAEMMKITQGSVKTHHFRALHKLQQVLYEKA
jgi:RNA polymerase sigma-70 factor (ECF subfamily)